MSDRREYHKAYFQAHREEIRAKQRAYYQANREAIIARVLNRYYGLSGREHALILLQNRRRKALGRKATRHEGEGQREV